jgi:hypothetical protein
MSIKYRRLNTKLTRLSRKQTRTATECHEFYPRVVSNTTITFTDNEYKLLNKGLKCNLHHKQKNCLTNLALEAETAISLLLTDRGYYRKQVLDRITQLHRQNITKPNHNNHTEWNTIKTIKTKLKNNVATLNISRQRQHYSQPHNTKIKYKISLPRTISVFPTTTPLNHIKNKSGKLSTIAPN